MCYIDHYTVDMNFYEYMEERGIAHTGSILTRNFRDGNPYVQDLPDNAYHVDTSSPEAMLDTLSQMNARMPMVRSIRGPYDRPRHVAGRIPCLRTDVPGGLRDLQRHAGMPEYLGHAQTLCPGY